MPPIDKMFAYYLAAGEASTLKAPALPLYGRTYAPAGHAALHTMAVLLSIPSRPAERPDQNSNLVYRVGPSLRPNTKGVLVCPSLRTADSRSRRRNVPSPSPHALLISGLRLGH